MNLETKNCRCGSVYIINSDNDRNVYRCEDCGFVNIIDDDVRYDDERRVQVILTQLKNKETEIEVLDEEMETLSDELYELTGKVWGDY